MPTPRLPTLDAATRAALDALDAAGLISLCPRCRVRGTVPHHEHPTLCEPCTIAEIEITVTQNAQRIAAGKSLAVWRRRDPDEDPPQLSRARWRELTAAIPRRDGSLIAPRHGTADNSVEAALARFIARG